MLIDAVPAVNEVGGAEDGESAKRKRKRAAAAAETSEDAAATINSAAPSKRGKLASFEVPTLDVTDQDEEKAGTERDAGDQHTAATTVSRTAEADGEENRHQQHKKAKAAAKKREERELDAKEESLLDPLRAPESAADFERLVMSSPNSSVVWICYISFFVEAAEIDKARAVAERALKIINFRGGPLPHCPLTV